MDTIQFDDSDVENAPMDVLPGEKTLVVGRDDDIDLDAMSLTPQEKTVLRLIAEKHKSYKRHKRSWSQAHLLVEQGIIQGLIIAMETFVTSVDAKIQLALWEDKF